VVTSMASQGTSIQVIALVDPWSPNNSVSDPFHLVVSANPHGTAPKKSFSIYFLMSSQDVSLVNPDDTIPAEHSANQDRDILKTFLKTQWWVSRFLPFKFSCYWIHRHKESFGTHTWMLKTLLQQLKANPQSESNMISFILYVIAGGFEKMHYWIKNGLLPLYFTCLTWLSKMSCDFMEHSKLPSRRPDGSNRDQLFLSAILSSQ
jgi:hypothetical protein